MRVTIKLNALKDTAVCLFPRIAYGTPFPRIRLFPRIRCVIEKLGCEEKR